MEKNKKNFFVRWYELEAKIYEKSPIGRSLEKIMFFVFLSILFIGVLWFMIYFIKPIPFEVEGSCNTRFVGVDYKAVIDNQPYTTLDKVYDGSIYDGSNSQDFRLISHRRYFAEYLTKEFNIKNIDGLNCNFKVKGAIPLSLLLGDW